MKTQAVILVIGMGASLAAQAAGLDYKYLEGGYFSADPDGGSSATGWDLDASFGVSDRVNIVAGYISLESGDVTDSTIGVGLHGAVSDKTDLFGQVGYEHEKADFGFGSFSDSGYFVKFGVRGMVTKRVELNANVTHGSVGDNYTQYGLGAVFNFTDRWSLSIGGQFDSDETDTLANIRYNF